VSDRLDEFRRQRALLREHLEWIDRQIARLEVDAPPGGPPEPPPVSPLPLSGNVFPPARASDLDAEAILAQYRQPSGSLQNEAKRGCLIYFVVGLAVLALAVTVLYAFMKRARGH
jgi:hypothetical protein